MNKSENKHKESKNKNDLAMAFISNFTHGFVYDFSP